MYASRGRAGALSSRQTAERRQPSDWAAGEGAAEVRADRRGSSRDRGGGTPITSREALADRDSSNNSGGFTIWVIPKHVGGELTLAPIDGSQSDAAPIPSSPTDTT